MNYYVKKINAPPPGISEWAIAVDSPTKLGTIIVVYISVYTENPATYAQDLAAVMNVSPTITNHPLQL